MLAWPAPWAALCRQHTAFPEHFTERRPADLPIKPSPSRQASVGGPHPWRCWADSLPHREPREEAFLPSADVVACNGDSGEEKQNDDNGQGHVLLTEGLSDKFRVHTADAGEADITPEDETSRIRDSVASSLQNMLCCWPAASAGTSNGALVVLEMAASLSKRGILSKTPRGSLVCRLNQRRDLAASPEVCISHCSNYS